MKTRVETVIDASADEVWNIIGKQFTDVQQWFSLVETSRPATNEEVPEGMAIVAEAPVPGRVAKSPAGTLTDIFIQYSNQERSYTFRTIDLPKFLYDFAQDHTEIQVLDASKCRVVTEVEMKAKFPFYAIELLFYNRMYHTLNRMHGDLKSYVEQNSSAT